MKRNLLFISLFVLSIQFFGQTNIAQMGHLNYEKNLSDVWGWANEDGTEYALVGVNNGLSIVDVSNPWDPTEVFFGAGAPSIWRDIKTWGHYAYVSNENSGGIYIVDLSALPGEITNTTTFSGSDYPFTRSHNLFIDEFGKLYIFGADNGNGGAIICDLTVDPMNPIELGQFDLDYLHDGMARGDTLWGGALYVGSLYAIDVSDPSKPTLMGSVGTPNSFTHNAWVSDNGQYVYTTDEVTDGYIGAYNVTDLDNMIEVDRIQTKPGTNVIPHNAHVLNDFIVTSYYTAGVTIHDASIPDNLFETGNFDTSPNYSGDGYNGCWGVYPFLPSGRVLATDIQEGLYILKVDYVRAIHVNGVVTDSVSGFPLFNIKYEVLETSISGQTLFDGSFEFGTLETGTYNIQFTGPDYDTLVVENVEFVNGNVIDLEVEMIPEIFTDISDNRIEKDFSVFPNPFTSSTSITLVSGKSQNNIQAIEVYDVTGKEIQKMKIENPMVNFEFGSDYENGLYFLKVIYGNQDSQTIKILKTK